MLAYKTVVIDLEGYKCQKGDFIIKELAICSDNIDIISFKPSIPFESLTTSERKAYTWTQKNLHGIHYTLGNYEYADLPQIMTSIRFRHPRSTFYAKGADKCKFLAKQLNTQVRNLDDLGCPKVEELNSTSNPEVCPLHCRCCTPKDILLKHCALRKAILFAKWMDDNFEDYDDINTKWKVGFDSLDNLVTEFDECCAL